MRSVSSQRKEKKKVVDVLYVAAGFVLGYIVCSMVDAEEGEE